MKSYRSVSIYVFAIFTCIVAFILSYLLWPLAEGQDLTAPFRYILLPSFLFAVFMGKSIIGILNNHNTSLKMENIQSQIVFLQTILMLILSIISWVALVSPLYWNMIGAACILFFCGHLLFYFSFTNNQIIKKFGVILASFPSLLLLCLSFVVMLIKSF